MQLMRFQQVVVNHLYIPAGHLQAGVAEHGLATCDISPLRLSIARGVYLGALMRSWARLGASGGLVLGPNRRGKHLFVGINLFIGYELSSVSAFPIDISWLT